MTKQDITTYNRLIAEFMGAENYPPNDYKFETEHGVQFWTPENMHYHKDWSWLMKVIDAAESLSVADGDEDFFPEFEIRPKFTAIDRSFPDDTEREWKLRRGTTKIEGAYLAVVDFIKWYNERK